MARRRPKQAMTTAAKRSNNVKKGMKPETQVTIYTDGACSGNPGPGGYGAILIHGERKLEISGGAAETTNNRMELSGAIKGLETLKFPCAVTLYTDSRYLCDAVNKGWLKRWRENNWMRNKKEKALNADLWELLAGMLMIHDVTFVWVKGHGENEFNNRCDELAVGETKRIKESL